MVAYGRKSGETYLCATLEMVHMFEATHSLTSAMCWSSGRVWSIHLSFAMLRPWSRSLICSLPLHFSAFGVSGRFISRVISFLCLFWLSPVDASSTGARWHQKPIVPFTSVISAFFSGSSLDKSFKSRHESACAFAGVPTVLSNFAGFEPLLQLAPYMLSDTPTYADHTPR